MNNLNLAIQAWGAALSKEQVVESGKTIKESNSTTYRGKGSYKVVLFPKNTDDVRQCLKVANRYDIAIYTVSKGKNFGLGSKLSVAPDHVLMDLSKMNTITDFSEELAYITVEPGVTFEQVSSYLRSNHSSLIMDSIGSTGEASIVGNVAERGHGVALQADRFSYCCGMEVVLPSGEVIHTGYEGLNDNKVGNLAKWGLGPSLDGLFTQSNFGVITKLTLWLQPAPKHFQIVMFQVKDDKNLKPLIEKTRSMMFNKLSFSLRIFNDYRMVSFTKQYPWQLMNGKTPLSNDIFGELKDELSIKGKWIGLGALYSINENFAEAEKSYIKEELMPFVESIDFYDQQYADKVFSHGTEQEKDFIDFIYNYSSLRGYTSERALNMCYWRVKIPIPSEKDLHRDGCGVLWYCPLIPNRSEDVEAAVKIIEHTSLKYNLEPNIGFLFISERVLDITGAICYDKTNAEEDKNAKACHDEIIKSMAQAGYPMYRLGVRSMHMTGQLKDNNKALNKALKDLFDPNNIFNRDRYVS